MANVGLPKLLPARLLTANELKQRAYDYFSREQTGLLAQEVS